MLARDENAEQISFPEGSTSRFLNVPAGTAISKASHDFEPDVHQVPTTAPVDPSVTPTPSITPISTTTPPSLTVPLPLVRQRTAQACDKCRERKTKCSGQRPCARCVARGLLCKYSTREARHRSPMRGIRGGGESSGNPRSAERSRYIDTSSARTLDTGAPNRATPSTVPMPPYRIRPSNPNVINAPAFAQRGYLDERPLSQRLSMSNYNTARRIDLPRAPQEGLGTGRLQDPWYQASQDTQTSHVGYGDRSAHNIRSVPPCDARMNGAMNDGQMLMKANRSTTETHSTTTPQPNDRTMYPGSSFPIPSTKDDVSSQVRASIEGPSRGGHWNFNIELTQYENSGLQPPVPPSAGLQQYAGTPTWPNQGSSRSVQSYANTSSQYSGVDSDGAENYREPTEYWGQNFSSSGDYEKSFFIPANASNIRGRNDSIETELGMQGHVNQQHPYQNAADTRSLYPQMSQSQPHYTNNGSFSSDLNLPMNDAYTSREIDYSDTRLSGLDRSRHSQPQGSLELNHPMPITPIGAHFASALSMPMHNHLSQFQGMERGTGYHRDINDSNTASELQRHDNGEGSFDFPPPKTFTSTSSP